MPNWNNELGRRTLERIQSEQVIWLTTVSTQGVPQPRPVWFVWDGFAFTIYSTPQAKKIVHINHNPNVALHFNTDTGGEDIQVILGNAHVDTSTPPSNMNVAYSQKYHAGILALGMGEEQYAATFSVAIRIIPFRLRGLDPIPGLG
ncbi:MAG TPA: TIGR03667 family PPOX class F420-dependent oxidoreductase [Anaerolineales bacterium]|nr:TIGR03667 family PPOX class F420-dependent oxidoreductase [Anaerolineales bacterium]